MCKIKKILTVFILMILVLFKLSVPLVIVNAKTYTKVPSVPALWTKDLDGRAYSVAWSPDGEKIAVGQSVGKIIIFSSDGRMLWYSDELMTYFGWSDVKSVAWSPDGSKIAVGLSNGGVAVLSASSGKILWISDKLEDDVAIRGLAWTPDGEKLIAGVSGKRVKTGFIVIFSALNGRILWISNDVGDRIQDIAISPDGSKIAVVYGTWSGYVAVFTVSTFSLLWKSIKFDSTPYTVAWSPDGKKIAVGLGSGKVIVFSASDGSILWRSEELGSIIRSVDWSPDSSKIVACVSRTVGGSAKGYDGRAVVLSALNGEALWVTDKLRYYEDVESVAWSPDGSKIAVGVFTYLRVFPLGDYAVIRIHGYALNLRILFFDGSNTDSYIVGKDGLKLWADSGSYLIKYYLVSLPKNYSIVGNAIDYFSTHPLEKTLTVKPESIYFLYPPKIAEFLSKLGKLAIRGSPGTIVNITWSSSDTKTFIIPDTGVLEVYAVPEMTYTIYVMPPDSKQYINIGKVHVSGEGEINQVVVSNETNIVASHTSLSKATITTTIQPHQSLTFTKSTTSTQTMPSIPPPAPPPPSVPPLLTYLLIGTGFIIGVVIISIIKRRRRYPTEEVWRKLEKEKESRLRHGITSTREISQSSTSSISPGFDLGIAVSLLNKRIEGLKGGYGCVENLEGKKVSLVSGLAPRGFEGDWICCLLGCGGWGCAYLCSRDGENVVFKVPRGFEGLFERGLAPTVSERLMRKLRERAEVIKALRHSNILRLLGFSEVAPVLVYEYADSGNIEWQLSKGWRPSLKDVLLLGIQVGDALRYIHSRGLVHGDVKPSNVFFLDGVAKIGDFSTLVKLISKTSSHSRFGYTPGFRAPEQAYSDIRLKATEYGLEPRMDVYMLGNLLLYILTGNSIDGEEAIKPGVVDEAVKKIEHAGLRDLIRKMLEPEPWKRPSSDEAVKELLKLYNALP